jgi:hypothetical protein
VRRELYHCATAYIFLSAFRGELAKYDLEGGWLGDRLKDTTDNEWLVFSRAEHYITFYTCNLRVFILYRPFQPSLIFARKAQSLLE